MKSDPDHENEIHKLSDHRDKHSNRVTPVVQLPPNTAMGVVSALAKIVQIAHAQESPSIAQTGGIQRAQQFEEGDVYMLEAPFEGFFADRYLMDFYDVRSRGICSRMHMHTGLRFVRMMTGPATTILISSFSPFDVLPSIGWTGGCLDSFTDEASTEDGSTLPRHNLVVPENAWVDMQIPRGVSHQFNADGPNAVIDSVHPEESLETLREQISSYKMMAQTIFLAEDRGPSDTCLNKEL